MLFQLDAMFFHGTAPFVDFDLYHMIHRYRLSHIGDEPRITEEKRELLIT